MRYKDLLRHRNVWLGVAMLWILLFHCTLKMPGISFLQQIGYGGVDICIFASGIGCFFSLSKDADAAGFMKRRLKRLLPAYLIFIPFWLVFQYLTDTVWFQMVIGNLLAVQNFTGNGGDFNWYISAIFLMYILAPYFYAVARKATAVRKVLFLAFLGIGTVPFWFSDVFLITVTRIPLFFMGMLFGDLCHKDVKITRTHIVGMVLSFAVGVLSLCVSVIYLRKYLGTVGLYWYPFILITPPLCVGISGLATVLEKWKVTKWLNSFLALCGDYSFELYLVHLLVWGIVTGLSELSELSGYVSLLWLAGCVCLVPGCFLLRRAAQLFDQIYHKCRPKKTKSD